jgi:signal recognition particle GTPase
MLLQITWPCIPIQKVLAGKRDLTYLCQNPDTTNWCLQTADFGPRTALKVVDSIRERVRAGKIKTGEDIRHELKTAIVDVLQMRGGSTELQLGEEQPSVILIVGVNGGGKTTTIGKLAHKFEQEGAKVPAFLSHTRTQHCMSHNPTTN